MIFTRSVSAQGGQDFYGFTRNVTIPPGATSTTVSLTIVNDAIAEPTETMQLRMFNATGATLVDNIGVVTITDDD